VLLWVKVKITVGTAGWLPEAIAGAAATAAGSGRRPRGACERLSREG